MIIVSGNTPLFWRWKVNTSPCTAFCSSETISTRGSCSANRQAEAAAASEEAAAATTTAATAAAAATTAAAAAAATTGATAASEAAAEAAAAAAAAADVPLAAAAAAAAAAEISWTVYKEVFSYDVFRKTIDVRLEFLIFDI